jgi:dienelactone hydrolase
MRTGLLAVAAGVLLAAMVMQAVASGVHASDAVVTEMIRYEHEGVRLRGVLAYNREQTGRRPGILVCHEWWGLNDYAVRRARMLAELGYVAFALDMYGEGVQTDDPARAGQLAAAVMGRPEVVRGRAAAGLAVLARHQRVDPSRLGVMGYCMGGTVSLELARSGLPHTESLRAVVVFHAGQLLAAKPEDNRNIRGTVLICHGQDDAFVREGDIDRFHAQMKDARVDYIFVSYAGAVHAFTNPDADRVGLPSVGYQRAADERSWRHMKDLFAERLGVPEPSGAPEPAGAPERPGR